MGLDAHVLFRGVDPDNCNILKDCLVSKRLGNVAMIALLRDELRKLTDAEASFPIILTRVIYNGTHSGDEIAARDVPQLRRELELLSKKSAQDSVKQFVHAMNELCDASLQTENPIVF
jgi:hypothetical protein